MQFHYVRALSASAMSLRACVLLVQVQCHCVRAISVHAMSLFANLVVLRVSSPKHSSAMNHMVPLTSGTGERHPQAMWIFTTSPCTIVGLCQRPVCEVGYVG